MVGAELLFKYFMHSPPVYLGNCSVNSVNIYLKTARPKMSLRKAEFSWCCWPPHTVLIGPAPYEGPG